MSFRRLLLSVALSWCASVAVAGGLPVALVASGTRSNGDQRFFEYYVTTRLGVVARDCGEYLAPEEFSKYALVVWLRGAPTDKAFTAEQILRVRDYLEAGGRLLMTNAAPYDTLGRRVDRAPWVQATAWSYNRADWHGRAVKADDPLLRDVRLTADKPAPAPDQPAMASWLAGPHALLGFRGVTVLGKAGEFTTLGYANVGKGRFYFSTYGPYEARPEEETESLMQVYRNMVMEASPLMERDEADRLLSASAAGREVALWRRDWSGATDRRLLWDPPGPRPEEMIESLDFLSARDEIDTAFFCVQSRRDIPELSVAWEPLRAKDGQKVEAGGVRVLVMGQEPEVPFPSSDSRKPVDSKRRGPFFLLPPDKADHPGKPAFRLDAFAPRTVWVQADTRGLAAGDYESRVTFSEAAGKTLAALPVRLRVEPIRMPDPRLVQLRTWGGGIGHDPRLCREMQRQKCDSGVISYPDTSKVKLRNTSVTLTEALHSPAKHLRGAVPPRLDFTEMWRDWLALYLDNGITILGLHDARTGGTWASAVTGEKGDVSQPFEQWPTAWREAFVDYYSQVQEYLSDRGYLMAYPLWTDEPEMEAIVNAYLPRAKAYMQAGMGPGSHWTTPGWMTPQDTNVFAPWTRDFSMYQYGYPNFRRYLREGLVRIPEHSMIGFTRGGTGLAVHQSHRSSRIQGWWVIHQGPPAHFVRTGPIWKGWLYYVDFTRDAWFRLGGVLGERLLAFGSSDPKDLSMDMLSSSDWEGGRDGVDDADLARMVEWFLPRLQARATGAWKERLKAIEAERALWFTDRSPFPIGQKPVDYRVAREGQPLLEYHITQASAAATTDIEKAKRYMVRLLLEMAPHTAPQDVQVSWHDWMLVRDGRAVATVVVSPAAADRTKAAAASIVKRIESATGLALPLRESDALDQIEGLKVLVGEASDRPVAALCLRNEWQLDDKYPGAGDYRIRRLPDQKVIAIMGVDQPGVERGVRSWLAFLNPQGHWLLSR